PKKELPNYPNKNNDIEIVGKYSFCHSDSEDDQELRAGNYIELLKEVTPGVKPSDLKRKLKRSKSADDITQIPAAPPPPNHLLTDQLKEKQKELEELRAKLEIAHQALKETKQLLDNSLEARTNALSE
ncbi:3546_t:CDS:2, partial [Funneliformis geosporum]